MRMSAAAGIGILMIAAVGSASAQSLQPDPVASGAAVEDIRDIRGPKSLTLMSASNLPLLVGAVVLIIAGYGLWRRRRGRSGARALLPSEIALQQLELARSIMQPATGREFGGRVSDVVRQYLERQFSITVTQRTTEEFLQDLLASAGTPLAPQRPLLAELLQQSDLIKFAGRAVTLQGLEALLQSARRLVHETAQRSSS
jgi:hypothetical protein